MVKTNLIGLILIINLLIFIMNSYDVIIIGSGPAGYTAGIYTARSNLTSLILEGKSPGGQLMTTTTIENFPGFESIDGFELMDRMKIQAIKNGCETKTCNVIKIEKHQGYFVVEDHESSTYKTKSIILAMGAYPNKLNFKNSDKYWNHGISSCAVCDGALPMFRKQTIVVVGGGDSAMEEALFLSKFASKVIILVRSDKLKASKAMVKKVESNDKIKIRFNNEVIEAHGINYDNDNKDSTVSDDTLESIIIIDNKTQEKKKIHCAGLFYAIGHTPNTELVKNMVELKSNKYIKRQDNSTKDRKSTRLNSSH
jgi:thioredoxin reductase (NADPH)